MVKTVLKWYKKVRIIADFFGAPPEIHTSNQIAERLKEIYKLKHIIKL